MEDGVIDGEDLPRRSEQELDQLDSAAEVQV